MTSTPHTPSYRNVDRERARRAIHHAPLLAELAALGLLAPDWRRRMAALRDALTREMRLYVHIDRNDADGLTGDAQCAETHDRFGLDPEQERLDLFLPAGACAADPGSLIEIRLVETAPGDTRPSGVLRRTDPGDHPALSARHGYVTLTEWRTLPDDRAPTAAARDGEA